jgi:hypothetical protein
MMAAPLIDPIRFIRMVKQIVWLRGIAGIARKSAWLFSGFCG